MARKILSNTLCKIHFDSAANLINSKALKKLKHIFNGIIWTLVGVYVLLTVLVHLSPVQHFLGSQVSSVLADKFDTKVTVGSVNLGFFNRIIIDDVRQHDLCVQNFGKGQFAASAQP